MTDEDRATALAMIKARIGLTSTVRDGYLTALRDAAIGQIEGTGIVLTDSAEDIMLLANYAAWMYQNRDDAKGRPDWLRRMINDRWLREGGAV